VESCVRGRLPRGERVIERVKPGYVAVSSERAGPSRGSRASVGVNVKVCDGGIECVLGAIGVEVVRVERGECGDYRGARLRS